MYGVLINNVQEVLHNNSGGGRGVVVVGKMEQGRLEEVGPEEEVGSLLAWASGSTIRLSKRGNPTAIV